MNRLKVAHITTVDMSLRYFLLNQLHCLQQAGYKVTAISSPGPEVPVLEAAGIHHIPVPMSRRAFTPLADLVALWRLYRVIRRECFTIVHTHTPKAGMLGRLAAKLAGVPVVVHTNHGFIFHERSSRFWRCFFITLEKVAAGCSNLVFSVNNEDIETAICEGVYAPEKIVSLGKGGIGIDIVSFDPRRFSPSDIVRKRIEVGVPEGVRIVSFVGRLVVEKGLLEFLQAARIVLKNCSSVRFLVIGPIDREKPDSLTPEIAHDYGVAEACIFTGMRWDMPELYALMDVFVLPSHREGFPRSSMEASAMGVPCVVTDVRGCREAVEHGRSGLVVPLGDVQALADAIIELLTDQEKALRMGEEGRCMALERFDERPVFDKVKAEYVRLLQVKGLVLPGTDSTLERT